ncbi:MAG: potassium transporter TrkG [Eubacteriales bacterium]|nr:potassium transporter TrkG [Eubacteriales bacterium]
MKSLFKQKKMSADKVLVMGFALIILFGAMLLNLPHATMQHKSIGFLKALFTATSATSVTGLVVVDTATTFNLFGRMVIITLIQVGGLGFMMFGTFIFILLGKRISLKNRMLMADSFNSDSLSGIVRLYRRGFFIALSIESIGALLLCLRFIPMYGFKKGIGFSVFHAISAFCNAGFDLFGNFDSITSFHNDPLVIFTTAILIVLGGLGFIVIDDVLTKKWNFKKFSLHSKIVLLSTAFLITTGTILLMITEYFNPLLWKENTGFLNKLMNMFFQSVTLRTAGFTSVQVRDISESGKLMSCIWMFIGTSPASTGGGVKTTTMFLLLLQTWAVIKGQEDLNIFNKKIYKKQSGKAVATVMIMFSAAVVSSWFVGIFEGSVRFAFLDIFYETISAMTTVGLSSLSTPALTQQSTAILILIMFLGRVGPLTLAYALGNHGQDFPSKIQYPEERILIG